MPPLGPLMLHKFLCLAQVGCRILCVHLAVLNENKCKMILFGSCKLYFVQQHTGPMAVCVFIFLKTSFKGSLIFNL